MQLENKMLVQFKCSNKQLLGEAIAHFKTLLAQNHLQYGFWEGPVVFEIEPESVYGFVHALMRVATGGDDDETR